MARAIDIAFDFRSDTPEGKDPDAASPTLRRYHKLLCEPLRRYADFFMLFADFRDYVDFFLLQDLVVGNKVKISKSYVNFGSSPVPKDSNEYRAYRDDAVAFIHARNRRIQLATKES